MDYNHSSSGFCQTPEPQEGEGTATYEFGNTVKHVIDRGEKVDLEYENREGRTESVEADLVVGADGLSSTYVRSCFQTSKGNTSAM